jgi:hypothetical protein
MTTFRSIILYHITLYYIIYLSRFVDIMNALVECNRICLVLMSLGLGLWHPSYTKIHVILSECDNVIENIHINMKREYLILLFWTKKSFDLQKNKNHVATFSYWFWFGNKKMFKIGS